MGRKILCSKIALGNDNYCNLSDTNLILFNNYKNKLWIRTHNTKLEHIGWELYLNINKNNEYVKLKEENINNNIIRGNKNFENNNLLLVKY